MASASVPEVTAGAPAPGGARPEPIRVGSLHVSDLKPTITESALYEFFRQAGDNTIASVRVCRDSQTGTSLGYAYVNFHNEKDAKRALEELNYQPIDGRPCRISWSHRDPSGRRSGVGNLFIKNLDAELEHLDLHDLFSQFGDILSCKISTDRSTGASRGYGFVQYESPDNAQKAIDALNGKFVNGKEIFVGPFLRKAQRASSTKAQFTNVYLKQFNPNLNQEKFAELLRKVTEEFGKITSPKLMTVTREDGTEESRGFGFANFESHEVAEKALERLKDQEKMKELAPEFLHPTAELYAEIAMNKEQRRRMYAQGPANRNLYVRNISEGVTEEQLTECFSKFGSLASPAKIMIHPDTKASKGFGFVCFDKGEDAREAITKMNGQLLEGKPLYVAVAQPKEQRRHQLQQQFQNRNMMMMGGFYPGMPAPVRYAGPPRGGPFRGARGVNYPAMGHGMQRGVAPRGNFPAPPRVAADSQGLRDQLARTPDDVKIQFLGDQLFSALVHSGNEDQVARRMVGMILSSGQNKRLEESVDTLLVLLEDRAALGEAVEQAKRSLGGAAPQQ